MRIGVYPILKPETGGIYTYAVNVLHALDDWTRGRVRGIAACPHQFLVFAHSTDAPELRNLRPPAWSIMPFRLPGSAAPRAVVEELPHPDRPREQPDMRDWMRACGVELMLYPSPHRLSFEAGVPFVLAVHDLQHRLLPQFPEVAANGEWERREYVFRNAARNATLLLVESETGREDAMRAYRRYGLRRENVFILPYACRHPAAEISPRERERVRRRLGIPDRYLIYPAQFWPHKNHLRLIEALEVLRRDHGIEAPLVLVGSASGAIREEMFGRVKKCIEELDLADLVHMPGYIEEADLAALVAGAVAMVMPTFFGPTNLPVLEAWALNCPVVTSDIRGIREQVGDAGILVDPRSVPGLADGLRRVWTDESCRGELVRKGRNRSLAYSHADFARKLIEAIETAVDRVMNASTRSSAAEHKSFESIREQETSACRLSCRN